jgi:ferritin
MDTKLFAALNDQVNEEAYSAYLYLSMSTWFEANHMGGFAKWMTNQAGEESKHAFKVMEYLQTRGHQPTLKAIAAPGNRWNSALEAFEAALAHEKHITGCYQKLMEQAHELRDHATIAFLNWFVTEQVEEEKTADDMVQKLRLAGESIGALMYLDGHANKRG